MKQRFYNEEDHRTELWPEHAHLPLYRATYSFEHNPKGHGQQATLILPTNDDFWVVAKFDEDLFDPDHPDRPTPAGIWCTYNREAFSNIEPLEGCKQFADIDSRALAVAQRLELQLDGRTFPGGRTQRVAMIQCAVAGALEEQEARIAELEALRPHWAQGHSDDSIAAQASTAALSELWQILGVDNQTSAVSKLRELKEKAHGQGQ